MFNFRIWQRIYSIRDGTPILHLGGKWEIILAFLFVSLPLLLIALLLIGFVFNASDREKPSDLSIGTPDLPIVQYDTTNAYYTGIKPGSFLLLGSWASNIAEIVVAPFMVIFSYAVAHEIIQNSLKNDVKPDIDQPLLSDIMRGGYSRFL